MRCRSGLSAALAVLVASALPYVPSANAATPGFSGVVEVGNQPVRVDVDAATGYIWVARWQDNQVAVVDPQHLYVVRQINVGWSPFALAVDPAGRRVYVADRDTVHVLNADTYAQVATIALWPSRHLVDMVVDRARSRLYVVANETGELVVVDTGVGAVVTRIPVGERPLAVDINTSTRRLYVGNALSDTISVVDGATNGVIATVATEGPREIEVDEATNRVFAGTYSGGRVAVIDAATNAITNSVEIVGPNRCCVIAFALDPVSRRLFIPENGRLAVMNADTLDYYTVPAFRLSSQSVVADPGRGRVLVANTWSDSTTSGSVWVYDQRGLATTTPPVTTATAQWTGNGSPYGNWRVTVSCVDETGCDRTEYYVDNGFAQAYTSPVIVGAGPQVIGFRSWDRDEVGNGWRSITV